MKASILCFILINCVVLSRCAQKQCFQMQMGDTSCQNIADANVVIKTDAVGDCHVMDGLLELLTKYQAENTNGNGNKKKYKKLYKQQKAENDRLEKEIADKKAQLAACSTELENLKKQYPAPAPAPKQYTKADFWKCGVGMQDYNKIKDSQLSASTELHYAFGAKNVRLYGTRDFICWAPQTSNTAQWVRVDLLKDTRIIGVATRGRPDVTGQWIKTYTLEYQTNGGTKQAVTDASGKTQVFNGNTEIYLPVVNMFRTPITARTWTLHPVTWKSYIAMQFDLLTCAVN